MGISEQILALPKPACGTEIAAGSVLHDDARRSRASRPRAQDGSKNGGIGLSGRLLREHRGGPSRQRDQRATRDTLGAYLLFPVVASALTRRDVQWIELFLGRIRR